MAPATMPDTIVVATTATADPAPGPPAPAVRLAAMKDVAGVDTFEVWICDVPTDTTDPTFGDPGLRLPLTADDVVHRAGPRLH